jgi:hypothetical protein
MQHLTFVVLEVCLATRGRAIHPGTDRQFAALQHFRQQVGGQADDEWTPFKRCSCRVGPGIFTPSLSQIRT